MSSREQLSAMRVQELKRLAKTANIANFTTMRKEELIGNSSGQPIQTVKFSEFPDDIKRRIADLANNSTLAGISATNKNTKNLTSNILRTRYLKSLSRFLEENPLDENDYVLFCKANPLHDTDELTGAQVDSFVDSFKVKKGKMWHGPWSGPLRWYKLKNDDTFQYRLEVTKHAGYPGYTEGYISCRMECKVQDEQQKKQRLTIDVDNKHGLLNLVIHFPDPEKFWSNFDIVPRFHEALGKFLNLFIEFGAPLTLQGKSMNKRQIIHFMESSPRASFTLTSFDKPVKWILKDNMKAFFTNLLEGKRMNAFGGKRRHG